MHKFINTSRSWSSLSHVHMVSPTVPAVVSYNKNMGGIDLNLQHRKYYSVGRKSHKWWQYLLWFSIDVSIINAQILEKEAVNHLSCLQIYFRLELAKMLTGDFSSHSLSVSGGRNTDGHWPKAASKGHCKRCLKGKVVKFCRLACTSCDKQICLECFPNHTMGNL